MCFDWEAGAKSLDSGTRQTDRPIWRDCLLVETDNPIQFHHYLSNLTLVTSAFLIGSLCNIFQFWVVKFHEISPQKKDPHSFWSRRRLPVAAPTPFGSGCSGLEMDQPRTCWDQKPNQAIEVETVLKCGIYPSVYLIYLSNLIWSNLI